MQQQLKLTPHHRRLALHYAGVLLANPSTPPATKLVCASLLGGTAHEEHPGQREMLYRQILDNATPIQMASINALVAEAENQHQLDRFRGHPF